MSNAHDAATHEAIKAMIGEIGNLRLLVAIDSMPHKLQQVRQLLRELDAEYEERAKHSAVNEYYADRAASGQATLTAHR